MSIQSRVIKVGAVKLAEIVLLTATKLIAVPVFLHCWSTALYGEWLVLYAALGYFTIGNLGVAQAAANEMSMLAARHDRRSVVAIYKVAFVALAAISLVLLTLTALVSYTLPLNRWLHLGTISTEQVPMILICFVGYVVLGFFLQLFVSGYRCEGIYHQGLIIWLSGNLIESIATIIVLLLGANPVGLAFSMVAVRLLTTLVLFIALSRAVPWLQLRGAQASMSGLRRIISSSLSFVAFPAGAALLNQGVIIIVAVTLGAVPVVVFTTLKTITNLGMRIYELINQAIYPEVSFAWGKGDIRTVRSIHRISWQGSMWAGLAASLVILTSSPWVYEKWTAHKVPFDFVELAILTFVFVGRGLWSTSFVIPSAINKHQHLAMLHLLASSLCLVAAVAFGRILPSLHTITFALLLLELVMTATAVPQALTLTEDKRYPFLKAVLVPPNLAKLKQLLRAGHA